MRPLRLIEDTPMPRRSRRDHKRISSFAELEPELKEKFFDQKLKLVEKEGKQVGKVTFVEEMPEEDKKSAWQRAFGWFK